MIAIIAALKDEVRDILAKMEEDEVVHLRPSTIYRGKYRGREIVLAISAVGSRAIRTATEFVIKHFNPEICLHVGYAGGTDPSLQAGDLIIANQILEKETEKSFTTDEILRKKATALCEQHGLRCREGNVVTVLEPLATPHEKAFVGTQFDALSVDMESSGLAECASAAGVPFVVARAIFDPLDMPLPDIPAEVIEEGNFHIWPMAKHMIHKPKDILNLPKFSYCANRARETLKSFIDAWLE